MENDTQMRSPIIHRHGSADRDDIAGLAQLADRVIQNARAAAMKPDSEKVLRRFTLKEATDLLGVHPTTIYELWDNPALELPKGEKTVNRNRLFTLEEIHRIQEHLKLLPRQRYDIRSAVTIAIANFKGGVAKTFTAATMVQYFALHGWKALAIDLDPQASLTSTFGVNPSYVSDANTVAGFYFGEEYLKEVGQPGLWTGTLKSAIQPTYWHMLDLVAANLSLYEGEFVLGLRRQHNPQFPFYRPLIDAIETIRGDYDVIVIDTPPSLSFSTTAALAAADGLVIPAPAAMLDLESCKAFLSLLKEMMGAMETYGFHKRFDFLKVLISKFQSDVSSQKRLASWSLSIFGEWCLAETMLSSKVIENLGPRFLTLYEAKPETYEKKAVDADSDAKSTRAGSPKISRAALKRALESANAVNSLIEADVVRIHRERQAQEAQAQTEPSAAVA